LVEEAYVQAQRWLQEAVTAYREVGVRMYQHSSRALLGYAAHRVGQSARAQENLRETLRAAIETGDGEWLPLSLSSIAVLLADEGQAKRAVELYALASRDPSEANSRWHEDVFGRHVSGAAATLPPEVVAAAQERGRARDLWATVEELLAEFTE
jgi:hypothetical protein